MSAHLGLELNCVAIPGCVNWYRSENFSRITQERKVEARYKLICSDGDYKAGQEIILASVASSTKAPPGTHLWRARKWEEKLKCKEKMLA